MTGTGGRARTPTMTGKAAGGSAVFCDTSVLVAAIYEPHEQHARSLAAVQRLAPKQGSCALHSLAECYAVLTRMPGPAPTPGPADVRAAMVFLREALTVVPLTASDYDAVLDDLASRRLVGGLVYDALILRCAARARADVIYTWNDRHFQRVAPELADKIRMPD
jgi:predicted nucleic acid-binding protein